MFRWILGDWRTIGFVVASTVLIYGSTIIGLRVTERRALAEMSAFDLVVMVAQGSIVGRTATAPSPSYVQGVAALAALVVIHHLFSWVRMRSTLVREAMDHPALVLVEDGELLTDVLAQAHLTEGDVWRVLREQQVRHIDAVQLLVMEGSGRFSLYGHDDRPIDPRLLDGLQRLR